MNIDKKQPFRARLILLFTIFTTVNVINLSVPLFETWNLRIFDFLFSFRSHLSHFRPVYDDTIVHVDLDDTSIQELDNYYLSRSHHAKVVSNLTAMGVAAQLHDFLIAAPSNKTDDSALIEAVANSQNAYFGLAFRLSRTVPDDDVDFLLPEVGTYLMNSKWHIEAQIEPLDFYRADKPLITFPPLANVSRGLGFLNMTPDRDGVLRRVPLLVRLGDAYYPSLPFRVICDYLGVLPTDIVIDPGKSIVLTKAGKPGEEKSDIVIPIDRNGNLIINFIGPWERMKHYHFSDVLRASDDQDELELWNDELSGRIAVVAEVTTGSSDVGPVPTDAAYPLSGINASVIHTILTQSFIHQVPHLFTIVAGMILLVIICLSSMRSSALIFSFTTLMLVTLYALIAIFLFLQVELILNVINPLIMVLVSFLTIQIVRALDNARILRQSEMEKHLIEHELEIGRQIQSGFFPEQLPKIPGWEISAFFRPTRQVSGDFYDSFPLASNRLTGIVIADVCDKGVGAALFMALTRSLIRAFASQTILLENQPETAMKSSIGQALKQTILLTNNYIAETHGQANMFATLFIGVLDPGTGMLHYINCGHEPPIIVNSDKQIASLKPTGPALGLFPDVEFKTENIHLAFGDLLFAFTDGVTDAQSATGELYSKERLQACLSQSPGSAEGLVQQILQNVDLHISTAKQFDDITMIALRRSYS